MAVPVAPAPAPPDGEQRFPIRLQKPTLLRIFGVRPGEKAMVTLTADTLDARFGIAHVRVPLERHHRVGHLGAVEPHHRAWHPAQHPRRRPDLRRQRPRWRPGALQDAPEDPRLPAAVPVPDRG